MLDLSNAYKQLALHPDCRRYSVVVLKHPTEQSIQCFEGRVLPFGAIASVVHFDRCSGLIQHLGYQLYLPWSSYFDDFPVISPSILSSSTMGAMTGMLDLLGFEYAKHKLKAFSTKADVLGVTVDFGRAGEDRVLIGNKLSRLYEINSVISKVLESGAITSRECSMTELRSNIRSDARLVHLSNEAKKSFKLMRQGLEKGASQGNSHALTKAVLCFFSPMGLAKKI